MLFILKRSFRTKLKMMHFCTKCKRGFLLSQRKRCWSCFKVKVAQSCPTLCDPWTIAHQAPPFMGFSRQEYWSGLPFPFPKNVQTTTQLHSSHMLVKERPTHFSILAWRTPWTEELGGLQSTGRKESDMTERLHFHFHAQTHAYRTFKMPYFGRYSKKTG